MVGVVKVAALGLRVVLLPWPDSKVLGRPTLVVAGLVFIAVELALLDAPLDDCWDSSLVQILV